MESVSIMWNRHLLVITHSVGFLLTEMMAPAEVQKFRTQPEVK
ncbi:hypothetical protein DFP90_11751 [Aestuariispira insulae]|uniref:Uncharacterized protein n=1 Tax=Aestuariispira insulae TaxID=1461337 RepID=A0A3D9H3R9_9PROT|nr:hypothetical protein DFP90_11751 [Aestuariispira insulae]